MVDSSIWSESDDVRIVWITMMARQDADHIVRGNAYNIATWTRNKTEAQVIEALKVLAAPDTKRIEPQEHNGRRIQKVPEGWLMLNGKKYDELMRWLAEKARKAKWAREHRALMKGKPLPGEASYERALRDGDEARAQEILDHQPGAG